MLVIEEVGAADLQAQWRAQRVRRPRTVAKNLAKKLRCAKARAEFMDVFVTDMALHRWTSVLPSSLNYQLNLKVLQSTYDPLLMHFVNSDEIAQWPSR